MASIRDVARIAGVSPSTVSRVMNGTANVEEDKRQKVLAAIQETGFKPNELARALFKQSSKIIGVIVPNIENPFFNELAKKEYDSTNPLTILNEVFATIEDRKKHPKEGSYTNYLFDKGIDKILKKCGEESTEIVIAAKNPDAEELKYEIADFLYHLMVLMVQCGLTWDDVVKELANRH